MFVLHGAVPLSGQTARNQPGRHDRREYPRETCRPPEGNARRWQRRHPRKTVRTASEAPPYARGPRHHAGDGALPARKCPSLVSDVLLSHGLLRSTIGARGLNFRVRNGTGCTSPAMVADQRGAFGCQGAGSARCPGGRTAQRVLGQKVARPRLLRVKGRKSSAY